jgi:hypothetical protein
VGRTVRHRSTIRRTRPHFPYPFSLVQPAGALGHLQGSAIRIAIRRTAHRNALGELIMNLRPQLRVGSLPPVDCSASLDLFALQIRIARTFGPPSRLRRSGPPGGRSRVDRYRDAIGVGEPRGTPLRDAERRRADAVEFFPLPVHLAPHDDMRCPSFASDDL